MVSFSPHSARGGFWCKITQFSSMSRTKEFSVIHTRNAVPGRSWSWTLGPSFWEPHTGCTWFSKPSLWSSHPFSLQTAQTEKLSSGAAPWAVRFLSKPFSCFNAGGVGEEYALVICDYGTILCPPYFTVSPPSTFPSPSQSLSQCGKCEQMWNEWGSQSDHVLGPLRMPWWKHRAWRARDQVPHALPLPSVNTSSSSCHHHHWSNVSHDSTYRNSSKPHHNLWGRYYYCPFSQVSKLRCKGGKPIERKSESVSVM